MRIRRLVATLLVAGLALPVTATAHAAPAPLREKRSASGHTITADDFGIHSFQGRPEVRAGTIRLNCSPLWKDMNPAPGVYRWSELDRWIAKAQGWGFSDIMFSFCATPQWAAQNRTKPLTGEPFYGPGSSLPPRMDEWRKFVRALVSHAKGRITAYQAWNEPTARYFWQGTPKQIAQMTRILSDAVEDIDPAAKVIGASVQLVRPAVFPEFYRPYLKELRRLGWPVDAIAVHGYAGDQGDTTRSGAARDVVKRPAYLRTAVADLRKARAPKRVELWDTETNFLGKQLTAAERQGFLARTFLDSWRFGVARTYWYLWTNEYYDWQGIQMMPGEQSIQTYDRMVDWTLGAKVRGCTTAKGLVTCTLLRGGSTYRFAYADSLTGKRTLRLSGPTQACRVDTGRCTTVKRSIKVGYVPIRLG